MTAFWIVIAGLLVLVSLALVVPLWRGEGKQSISRSALNKQLYRQRLLEIGEAVKGLTPELTALEPEIPWTNSARMRDFLAHHYFATNPEIVQAVIDKDLPPLREAVTHLRTTLPGDSSLTVNG